MRKFLLLFFLIFISCEIPFIGNGDGVDQRGNKPGDQLSDPNTRPQLHLQYFLTEEGLTCIEITTGEEIETYKEKLLIDVNENKVTQLDDLCSNQIIKEYLLSDLEGKDLNNDKYETVILNDQEYFFEWP